MPLTLENVFDKAYRRLKGHGVTVTHFREPAKQYISDIDKELKGGGPYNLSQVIYRVTHLQRIEGLMSGSMERARIELEIGRGYYKIRYNQQATAALSEAVSWYRTRYHEYAFASLMLGRVYWELRDFSQAFSCWNNAILALDKVMTRLADPILRSDYENWIKDINNMLAKVANQI